MVMRPADIGVSRNGQRVRISEMRRRPPLIGGGNTHLMRRIRRGPRFARGASVQPGRAAGQAFATSDGMGGR